MIYNHIQKTRFCSISDFCISDFCSYHIAFAENKNSLSTLEEATGIRSEEHKKKGSRTAPTRQGSSSRMLGNFYETFPVN